MNADLETLRAFFASAPFMADVGIAPAEAASGRVVTQLVRAPCHRQHTGVVQAFDGPTRTLIGKASATMAVTTA